LFFFNIIAKIALLILFIEKETEKKNEKNKKKPIS